MGVAGQGHGRPSVPGRCAVANFERRSGTPYARTVSVTGGRTILSITVRVEPIGSRQLPDINLLHLRVEKLFRLRQAQKVSLRLNVFNAMNINTVTNLVQLSGPNFERPTSIMPPESLNSLCSTTFDPGWRCSVLPDVSKGLYQKRSGRFRLAGGRGCYPGDNLSRIA